MFVSIKYIDIKLLKQFLRLYNILSPLILWKIVRGDIIWLHLLKIPEVEKVKFSISYIELFGKKLRAPNKRLLRNMISALAEAMMYYRFKRSHRIILDIGGFLGETALWFIGSRQAKKVVIVEPIPLFVKYIKTNLKNCLVDVVQAAVCHKPVARLKVNGIFSRITENSGQGEVPAVSLEELLSLYDATAIKMDCEGCEQVLIETPYEVLSRIDEMIIELHYGLVDVHNIRKKMKEYGFYEVVLYDDLANNKILHKFPVVLVHFFRESENL